MAATPAGVDRVSHQPQGAPHATERTSSGCPPVLCHRVGGLWISQSRGHAKFIELDNELGVWGFGGQLWPSLGWSDRQLEPDLIEAADRRAFAVDRLDPPHDRLRPDCFARRRWQLPVDEGPDRPGHDGRPLAGDGGPRGLHLVVEALRSGDGVRHSSGGDRGEEHRQEHDQRDVEQRPDHRRDGLQGVAVDVQQPLIRRSFDWSAQANAWRDRLTTGIKSVATSYGSFTRPSLERPD
jgi:hypothetical protein